MILSLIPRSIDSVTSKIKRYRVTAFLLVLLAAAIIAEATRTNNLKQALVYLSAILFSAIIIEMIALVQPAQRDWTIKELKSELRVVLFSITIFILLSIFRFIVIADFQHLNPLIRILFFILVLLFIYPVFLAFYFLIRKKYKLFQLGITFFGYGAALPVIGIIGLSTWLLFPHKMQFVEVYQESGLLSFITLGFLTAAIPEEFVRVLMQSRFSFAFSNNRGLAWITANTIWALVHIPNFYNKSGDYYNAIISAVGIIPIGLLWGYITERFKSIFPSVLIHGTNLWGLQNLF